jgi:hypothetical protein
VALCALIPGMPPEALLILETIAQTYSASNELDGSLPSECLLVDDHNIDCAFPFSLPTFDLGAGPDAVLEATGLYGSATGLSLEGEVTFVGASVTPRQPLTLDGLTPTYMVGGSCSAITTGYEASLFVGGGTGVYCPDPTSGEDSPMVVDDPVDAYWVTEVGSGPADTADIGFPGANDDAFWNYPAYGPQIAVWSNVGSGTVELEVPEQFDWSIEWWVDNYLARWINCNAEETGLFGIPGLFDFNWLVDPPYGTLVSADRTWNGAQATMRSASITQTGASSYDARTGIRTIPARSASLTTSWSVASSRGSFTFETSVTLGVALQGTAMNEGWAMVLSAPLTTSISVPRASLPRGVRSATVSLSLDPTDLVLTGVVSR